MKIVMIIIIFLCIGMFFIISENSLALRKDGNFQKAISLYSSWLSQIFENVKGISAYAVKVDWLPESEK